MNLLNTLFVELLNRGISASWLIVAVVVLRLVLKRAPKWIACLLWAMVAVRLACPVNIPSPVSVYNLMETRTSQTGSVEYFYYNDRLEKPEVSIDFPAIPGYPDNQEASAAETGIHTSSAYLPPLRAFWLIGVVCMAAYGLSSYLKLRKKVRVSLKLTEKLWICDDISSPFILGVLRPRIYLPSDLSGKELHYVMAHEQAHLQRRDHWWKLLGYLLLTVYWFHPLVCVAYGLFCRDIELACDEKVCKGMDAAGRKAYAIALLNCSVSQRSVAVCPLAFGEVGVKERVKSVVNYKKPAFWVVVVGAIVCIIVGACFLTNPANAASMSEAMDSAASSAEDENHEALLKEYEAFGVTEQDGSLYYQDKLIRYFLDGYEKDDRQGGQNVISRYAYYNEGGTIDVHTVRNDTKNSDGNTELFGPIIDIVPYPQEEFDQRQFISDDSVVTDTTGDTAAEEQARELIQKAFSCDVSGIEPEKDTFNDGQQTTFWYTVNQGEEKYYVQFSDETAYPMMVYHFCHPIEDENFDLAQESSDYFKEDMVQAAKDFVKKMYDVDCSDAEVHAYGYQNKICVQLELAPDKAFHVRFYYDDLNPVGILFCHDVTELERLMETNGAKQYF